MRSGEGVSVRFLVISFVLCSVLGSCSLFYLIEGCGSSAYGIFSNKKGRLLDFPVHL